MQVVRCGDDDDIEIIACQQLAIIRRIALESRLLDGVFTTRSARCRYSDQFYRRQPGVIERGTPQRHGVYLADAVADQPGAYWFRTCHRMSILHHKVLFSRDGDLPVNLLSAYPGLLHASLLIQDNQVGIHARSDFPFAIADIGNRGGCQCRHAYSVRPGCTGQRDHVADGAIKRQHAAGTRAVDQSHTAVRYPHGAVDEFIFAVWQTGGHYGVGLPDGEYEFINRTVRVANG